MTWPVPDEYEVTTDYGKRGPYWSCNPNSSGDGVHTGVDLACPNGTPLYAVIPGQIRHRKYGSAFGSHQFAISPDPGQPWADGEVFYAHTRTRLADGVHVEAGQYVGESGDEGNVSGPHLHLELHPDSKGMWSCAVHADPTPALYWEPEEPEQPEPPEPEEQSAGFGLWTWYSGKRTNDWTVHPGDWRPVDLPAQPPSGITANSTEFHFLYLRLELPDPRSATRTVETRWIRSDGDATAYWSPAWTEGARDSIAYANTHLESGSGLGGHWEIRVSGGSDPVTVTTRYAKTHVHYLDPGQVAMSTARALPGALARAVLAWLTPGTRTGG